MKAWKYNSFLHSDPLWVRHWLHFGTLLVEKSREGEKALGEKMSKSMKNFITPVDFGKKVERLFDLDSEWLTKRNIWRLYCSKHHYRSSVVFSYSGLNSVVADLQKLKEFFGLCQAYAVGRIPSVGLTKEDVAAMLESTDEGIKAAICNDFNVPEANRILLNMVTNISAKLVEAGEDFDHERSHIVEAAEKVKSYLSVIGVEEGGDRAEGSLSITTQSKLNKLVDDVNLARDAIRNLAMDDTASATPKELRQRLLAISDNIRENLLKEGLKVHDRYTKKPKKAKSVVNDLGGAKL